MTPAYPLPIRPIRPCRPERPGLPARRRERAGVRLVRWTVFPWARRAVSGEKLSGLTRPQSKSSHRAARVAAGSPTWSTKLSKRKPPPGLPDIMSYMLRAAGLSVGGSTSMGIRSAAYSAGRSSTHGSLVPASPAPTMRMSPSWQSCCKSAGL